MVVLSSVMSSMYIAFNLIVMGIMVWDATDVLLCLVFDIIGCVYCDRFYCSYGLENRSLIL